MFGVGQKRCSISVSVSTRMDEHISEGGCVKSRSRFSQDLVRAGSDVK